MKDKKLCFTETVLVVIKILNFNKHEKCILMAAGTGLGSKGIGRRGLEL